MNLGSAKLLGAIILLSLGSAAIAENLVRYESSPTGTIYYYDAKTIRRSTEDTVVVWMTADLSKDKTVPYRRAMAKWKFDCSAETMGSLAYITYRANGTTIDNEYTDIPDMTPIIPGSVGQTLFDIMCLETDLRRQFNLGLKYAEGEGVAQDYATAVSWYRKAADRGYADAQNNLGVKYYNGEGVAQDYAAALSWYRKAADRGYAPAQTRLGIMYKNGIGVGQDYAAALSWYRKAADQGYAQAQSLLGLMYKNGRGVVQDDVQALKWYVLSVASGSENAKTFQDNLAAEMTSTQIAEAKRLARAWVKK